jgi:predicted nucleic acid-binding protein
LTVSVSEKIAERAAQLRADYGLPMPDAIQVTTALVSGANSLLTIDASLTRRIAGHVTLEILVLQKLI